jgi:hypothetical protein
MEAGDAQSQLPDNEKVHGSTDQFAASKQFLNMVHYDESPSPGTPGGRMYTYVITLQGEWRFSETGPEFSIQFLSKHSMHSDISEEVAHAGEFFVRRLRGKGGMKLSVGEETGNQGNDGNKEGDQKSGIRKSPSFEAPGFASKDLEREQKNENDGNLRPGHQDLHISKKPVHSIGQSRDPRNFVLIIDNDSGTYRPDKKYLPEVQKYLERNLPGLKIKAMAYDDERLKKWKEEQKPKKNAKARKIVQPSSSSSASEDDF